MRCSSLVTLVLAGFLSISAAAVYAGQQSAQPQTVAEILKLQHELRDRLDKPSGEYSRFDATAIRKMEMAQDKVFRMLDGVQSLDALNAERRTELSNALDEIKAVLLSNEGSRMICYRERKTGSNIIEKRCETVADREQRAREATQMMMHDGISR